MRFNHLTLSSRDRLEVLYLGGNQLEEIPAEVGDLCRLRALNLAGNKLQSLPISLSQLHSLQLLNLHDNALQTLPLEIVSLNLVELSLRSNPLVSRFVQVPRCYPLHHFRWLFCSTETHQHLGVIGCRLGMENSACNEHEMNACNERLWWTFSIRSCFMLGWLCDIMTQYGQFDVQCNTIIGLYCVTTHGNQYYVACFCDRCSINI